MNKKDPTKKQKNVHYVNNKEFHEALVQYRNCVRRAAEKEIPDIKDEDLKNWRSPDKPKIPNYLGDCFLKISTHLSYRPNFVNYMYRDDMISDGVENCVQYILNFDIERTNPFAYFTQIVYYAFLRRIGREKKQVEIKEKILERSSFDEVFAGDDYYSTDYNSIKDNIHIKTRY
jgi:hypothetical protein